MSQPIEVVILGTSSAAPTVRRHLSGMAIIREGETLLFDCGEGTQFRLLEADVPRRKFHHVFITHLHGDHVFGLGGLISSLNLAQREYPLHIHGPRGIRRFVTFMTSFPRRVRLGFQVHVHEFPAGYQGVIRQTRDYAVLARPLDHTIPVLGYRFQERDAPGKFDAGKADELGIPFGPERGRLIRGEAITLEDGRVIEPEEVVGSPRPGRAVVYCTDTALTANATALARGADLLIHEATYGDDALDMAAARKHSTIRHAATVARDAGARKLVATHFSTRYDGPSMRQLRSEGREIFPGLIMAKDLLRITL